MEQGRKNENLSRKQIDALICKIQKINVRNDGYDDGLLLWKSSLKNLYDLPEAKEGEQYIEFDKDTPLELLVKRITNHESFPIPSTKRHFMESIHSRENPLFITVLTFNSIPELKDIILEVLPTCTKSGEKLLSESGHLIPRCKHCKQHLKRRRPSGSKTVPWLVFFTDIAKIDLCVENLFQIAADKV